MSVFVMNVSRLSNMALKIGKLLDCDSEEVFDKDFKRGFRNCVIDCARESGQNEYEAFVHPEKQIYNMLYSLNCAAYRKRYKDCSISCALDYRPNDEIDDFQFVKSIDCWLYQCGKNGLSEYEGLFINYIEKISEKYSAFLFRQSAGYKEAEWS